MNKDIVEQYEALRTSINGNINTIRSLLNQADMLNRLVESLNGEDTAQKEELEANIKGLYKIINELIIQTNSLFKQFAEFATSVKARQ